jgi:hypothetical protein
LSFSDQYHAITLPWNSIWGVNSRADGQLYTFPDEIPRELLSEAAAMVGEPDQMGQPVAEKNPELVKYGKPILVWNNPEPVLSPPRRGHLSLVKPPPEEQE